MTSQEQNNTTVVSEAHYEEISVSPDQPEPTFTKFELALATLLSICVYTIFWTLGVSLGFLVPKTVLPPLVGAIGFLYWKKILRTKLHFLWTDIFWCLLVSMVIRFALPVGGVGMLVMLPLSILIGGVVTGVYRRKNFQRYTKKKIIKYGFLLLLILGIPASAFLGFALYFFRTEIPFDYLHPSTLSEGWVLIGEDSGIIRRAVNYKKNNSQFAVETNCYPEEYGTEEEIREEIKTIFESGFKVSDYIEKSKSEADVKSNLTREETWEIDGLQKYIFQYDSIREGESLPFSTTILCSWYCPNLKRYMHVTSLIEDKPIDKYVNEIEDMIRSLDCPQLRIDWRTRSINRY